MRAQIAVTRLGAERVKELCGDLALIADGCVRGILKAQQTRCVPRS